MSVYHDNPYKVLGLDLDASDAEIKKAYRKLALKHHPDRQNDADKKQEANTKFSKIANAYEILSDDHLKAEYDRSVNLLGGDGQQPSSSAAAAGSNNNNQGTAAPPVFRYHFSDPYEIFKRDFKAQFGIEYPGAQYDWVDFDHPMTTATPALPASTGKSSGGGGSSNKKDKKKAIQPTPTTTTKSPDTTLSNNSNNKKKKGFNLFRRNKKNNDKKHQEEAPSSKTSKKSDQQQLVVRKKNPTNPTTTALARPKQDNSRALVATDKKNNRPVSMDVSSKKKGTVTTTTMTMTRPDGTVETVTMRSGIPGKAPSKLPQLTNGDTATKKMLPSSSSGSKGRLTNGKDKKMLTNGSNAKNQMSAQPKRKLLGWK